MPGTIYSTAWFETRLFDASGRELARPPRFARWPIVSPPRPGSPESPRSDLSASEYCPADPANKLAKKKGQTRWRSGLTLLADDRAGCLHKFIYRYQDLRYGCLSLDGPTIISAAALAEAKIG